MNIELVGNLFMFAGGIGMFLYGMNIMADGMQKSAGSKMKQLIGYLTRNRLLAVLVGAFITAIIQSSGHTLFCLLLQLELCDVHTAQMPIFAFPFFKILSQNNFI